MSVPSGHPCPRNKNPEQEPRTKKPPVAVAPGEETDLFGAPVVETEKRNGGTIVDAWIRGYRDTHGGRDPDPSLLAVVRGNAKRIARDRDGTDASWERAIDAAYRAGTTAHRDLYSALEGPRTNNALALEEIPWHLR